MNLTKPKAEEERFKIDTIEKKDGSTNSTQKVKAERKGIESIDVVSLGLDNAGKTTIVKKFNGEDISSISPTLGFNIQTLWHKDYKLNIWDIGGQRTLRSYWRNYYEENDAIIWVIDSSDIRRLDDCKNELKTLLEEEKLAGASLLILANKQDLSGSKTKEEIADYLELKSLSTHSWKICSCSAVTGEGLEEAIDWVVNDIISRCFVLD
ncbi:ARF-like protein [Cavenderia fasciculata]|uniref:ADP-ribosylation factor-like protein 2 n=1 Tax=Cavenderia fasciculata TaxID=261658 RepID=F4PMB4_CACFS|nr:ARF-like protein [Cavenderia fasciculata]EGG22764.1 ARF-like protein [Cavenderia fasciculata]|eukprot:XP_004360615.1 ARF-like protein [Cavenderia fasciculata]